MDNTSQDQFLIQNRRDSTILAGESTQTLEQAHDPQGKAVSSQAQAFSRETLRHRDGFGRLKNMSVMRQEDYYLRPKDGRLAVLTVQRSNRLASPTPWIIQIIRYVPNGSPTSTPGSIRGLKFCMNIA